MLQEVTRPYSAAQLGPSLASNGTEALNHAHKNFLHFLDLAVSRDAFIFSSVLVTDVLQNIYLHRDTHAPEFPEYAVSEQTFDFVLCSKRDLSVLAILCLDDRKPQHRDGYKDDNHLQLCRTIKLPYMQIEAHCGYPLEQMQSLLRPYLKY